MTSHTPLPPATPPRWPLGFVKHYQLGSSVLPSSSLFKGLTLLLIFVLLVFAGIFYAEGNRTICWTLVFVAVAIILGPWYLKKRKGV